MGLYDSVDRGKPKPKRLTGPIALCCALFLLFGGLTYWACHYQFRFHAFISDLTDSTRDARSTETFRVTVNGSETDVSIDDLSDLLYLIDKAGAGRTAAAPEEMPYAVIDYGDGSTLEIWKVELVNPSNDWTEGPFFRYTDAKGKSYGYDTDQLRWESVVRKRFVKIENGKVTNYFQFRNSPLSHHHALTASSCPLRCPCFPC